MTPCAVETVGSVMHGGVGLCSCRHLVDEVCEGPVVPVTLVVNITEFEVARARIKASEIDILANSKIRLCSVQRMTQIQNTS